MLGGEVSTIICRKFLFDDIGLNRYTEMIGLTGQVRGEVEVVLPGLERGVARVAPQHGEHAELVRLLEHLRRLLQLPLRLFRAEVNRRADAHRTHVERLLDAARP